MGEELIRAYYSGFNERRFAESGALFASDATVEYPPFTGTRRGAEAYIEFAQMWVRAFPDGHFLIEQVAKRGDTIWEVDLVAEGCHRGSLDMGRYGVFKPTGTATHFRIRELLEIRGGRITFSSLSFDVQDLVRQLTAVDMAALMTHLEHIDRLHQELTATEGDDVRRRQITDRLGTELDAARKALRPYFYR